MTDRDSQDENRAPDSGAYEVDIETAEEDDLDEAMREALEAVEKGDPEEPEGPAETRAETVPEMDVPEGAAADIESKLAGLREQNLRTLADFENFRKRVEKERSESRRYEGFGVLVEILPLLDNLQRALEAEGGVEDLKVGVGMIARQFQDLLKRNNVDRIASVGEPFDPMLHDAVSREEDPETEMPTVAEELQPGYMMGERLLRPASVRVRMPSEGTVEASQDAADPESSN